MKSNINKSCLLASNTSPEESLSRGHLLEEGVHCLQQSCHRAMKAIGGYLALQPQPYRLNRIEMRTVLGQEEQFQPCVFRLPKPLLHSFGCMRGVVVHHQHDSTNRVGDKQLFQESQEVFFEHPLTYQVGPLSTPYVECPEQSTTAVGARSGYSHLLPYPVPHGSDEGQQLYPRLVGIHDMGQRSGLQYRLGNAPLLECLVRVGLSWHREAGPSLEAVQSSSGAHSSAY